MVFRLPKPKPDPRIGETSSIFQQAGQSGLMDELNSYVSTLLMPYNDAFQSIDNRLDNELAAIEKQFQRDYGRLNESAPDWAEQERAVTLKEQQDVAMARARAQAEKDAINARREEIRATYYSPDFAQQALANPSILQFTPEMQRTAANEERRIANEILRSEQIAEQMYANNPNLLRPAGLSAPPPPIPLVPSQPAAQPTQLSTFTPTTGQQASQTTSPQGQSFLTGTQPTGTNMVTPLNPATLPPLRGAAAGASSIDPTLRPYLELGLRGAEQLFLQQQPSLFPGQMFVSPSEQTQAALNMQEDIALAQPTTLQAAQESFMRGLGGLGATAGGAFLMGSPYRQDVIQAATRPLMQQFEETTLPGISSQFSRAGRYGSGAMERALGQATEATGRAIGDIASNIAFQDYSAERQRQQQALGLQLQGATLAPQIYGQQFLPSQQLAQVGAAREAIAAQPLQEAIQRYQFEQQIPYQQLQGFLSSVYGTPLAGSQYQPPAQTNRAASALGGAALGAGIGQMIGGGFGGFSAPTIGAALGGLGGLLF